MQLCFINQLIVPLIGKLIRFSIIFPKLRRIPVLAINRISLCPQMREHVMPAPCLALVPKRRDVNGRDYDSLARPRAGLREKASIIVHDLTPARP
jgi:hypothetical protein